LAKNKEEGVIFIIKIRKEKKYMDKKYITILKGRQKHTNAKRSMKNVQSTHEHETGEK